MTSRTSAGTTLHIASAAPATYDSTGYAALTWVAVGEVVDLGEFGRQYNKITHNPLGTRSTHKKKGSYNEGTMSVQLALDTDDAGQIMLKTAALSDSDYSFKVTTQNTDKYYFQAQVDGFRVGIGGVDKITSASVNLDITSNSAGVGIVEVLAP